MSDLIKEYLKSLKTNGRKPSTIKNAEEGLIRWRQSIGKKDLLDIDREDIEKYIEELAPTNSQRSISQQIGIVKRFYDFVVEDLEILHRNPVTRKAKRLQNDRTITNRPKRDFDELRHLCEVWKISMRFAKAS